MLRATPAHGVDEASAPLEPRPGLRFELEELFQRYVGLHDGHARQELSRSEACAQAPSHRHRPQPGIGSAELEEAREDLLLAPAGEEGNDSGLAHRDELHDLAATEALVDHLAATTELHALAVIA